MTTNPLFMASVFWSAIYNIYSEIRLIPPVSPPQKSEHFKQVKTFLKDFPKTFF